MIGYCETTSCRRLALLSYFDETTVNCGNCDNCLSPPEVEDYTDLAKRILAAVIDTGQFFGVMHVIDVLRGTETAKVKARSHHQLGVFGVAKSESKQALQSIIRQMIAIGALRVNLEKYGALEVGPTGRLILSDDKTFRAKALSKTTNFGLTRKSDAASSASGGDPWILAELKKLRLEIARAQSVPAYVIFTDRTLMQMATEMPTTRDEFMSINGVGKTKLTKSINHFLN